MPFLAPLAGAVAAFAGTWFGSLVISIGASLAVGLLKSWLDKDKQQQSTKQKPAGFKLSVQMGDTGPLSFPVGRAATAGSRKYRMTWGQSGEVPNAYLTYVDQISDIPGVTLDAIWIDKQKCTILTDFPTAWGNPIAEYRSNGVDYAWVKFRTGLETTADTFLTSIFGAHPDYPWLSDMIGRGTPNAIVTTLFNRELFKNGPAEVLYEPTAMKFYDLRKDSTNGGSGSHRWDDQSTWEATYNPVVIMYNIIRGIYYNGEWIYGGRNIAAFRLPASSWIAAANECDVPRSLSGGGTEPQFRCGAEISVDVEPLAQLEDLKRSCNARISEIGGIFEIMVGAPGAAVYAFTDEDIVVSRKQGYRSFPSLNDTHNGIEATYPEPSEMWALKDAPARYNAAWEAEDGGRRLATGLQFSAVPFNVQVQQLMLNLINDNRRWRVHIIALPPSAWVLTGTSIVSWTSTKNGYTNKKFWITKIDGEPGMIQPAMLLEIDPTDYGWTSAEQLPSPIGVLTPVRPGPQLLTGFQALPAIIYDSDNEARRPSIQIVYDGNMPDIQFVHVLVRLKSSGAYVFDGFIPFEVPYSNVLNGVFLPNTLYEAAAKYIPYTGRPTEFTEYQDVTTPNVLLVSGKDFSPFGDIDLEDLGDDISGYFDWIGSNVRELYEQAQRQALLTGDQELANAMQFNEVRREVATSVGTLSASFSEVITTAILPLNGRLVALADAITSLSAGDGTDINTARFRMTAMTGPAGYSRIGGEVRFDPNDAADWTGRAAAFYLDAPNNPADPSRFVIIADQFVFDVDGALENPFIIDGMGLRANFGRIGTLYSGRIESYDGLSFWDLDNGNLRIG